MNLRPSALDAILPLPLWPYIQHFFKSEKAVPKGSILFDKIIKLPPCTLAGFYLTAHLRGWRQYHQTNPRGHNFFIAFIPNVVLFGGAQSSISVF
jgi:hypothetical protein